MVLPRNEFERKRKNEFFFSKFFRRLERDLNSGPLALKAKMLTNTLSKLPNIYILANLPGVARLKKVENRTGF